MSNTMKNQNLPKLKKVTKEVLSKPKILLLSDDLFAPSGIGTQSRSFVFGTSNKFRWVQLAAAVKHPYEGQMQDISDLVTTETGYADVSVKLYYNSGYGSKEILQHLLQIEKPDAILHFTDPRFWGWLYEMEYEIHQRYKIPIMYYAIWDNFPLPIWNKSAYASCDLIMGISKQSHLIHNEVLKSSNIKTIDIDIDSADNYQPGDVFTQYVPHGINLKHYYPITIGDPAYAEYIHFETEFRKRHNAKFVFFWTNRNIKRKNPADLIHAFKLFVDKLQLTEKQNVVLLMHTQVRDENGTDLLAVKEMIAPDCNIIFSNDKIEFKYMNFYYNLADVTINIAGNEGFGLSSAESLSAGTPILNTVTGGLQDQCRFEDDNGNWIIPTVDIPSNHTGIYKKCGEWAFPIFPTVRTLQGSLPTPYIFDDIIKAEDLTVLLHEIFHHTREELKRRGEVGRQWLIGNESCMSEPEMSKKMANVIQLCLDKFKPKNKVILEKVNNIETVINPCIVYENK